MLSVRILGIVSALLFSAMALYTFPLTPSIPAIQLTFSESAFRTILTEWTPLQVEIFKRHFLIDYPFLISYGVLGYLISTKTNLFSAYHQPARALLTAMLPVASIADAIENSMHLVFLYGAGPFGQEQYFAAGAAALTKWLLIGGYIGSAGYAKSRPEDY